MTTLASRGDLVSPIRNSSRQIVRSWGFMRPTIAASGLSAIATHALIEIGDYGANSSTNLCQRLRTESFLVDQALRELIEAGYISIDHRADGEIALTITRQGRAALDLVNNYATVQVQKALDALPANVALSVKEGLNSYAWALHHPKEEEEGKGPEGRSRADAIRIVKGYQPGLLGAMLQLHMDFYSRTEGWGRSFETSLATDMAEVIDRIDLPHNEAWAAVQPGRPDERQGESEGRIVGTIFVDGDGQSTAQIRCFIVDRQCRGAGLGRRLLDEAMRFVREVGYSEVALWTMANLKAAVRLYEGAGFVLTAETETLKWGQMMNVARYTWRRPQDRT